MALLSQRHRRFLFVDQCAFPALFNFVINGGLFWLLFKNHETISLWGSPSIGIDLVITALLLPLLTTLIVSPLVVRQVKKGSLERLSADQLPGLAIYARSSTFKGVVLGLTSIFFAAMPIILLLSIVQRSETEIISFALYKGIWSALLAMMVTPVIAWWALAKASQG